MPKRDRTVAILLTVGFVTMLALAFASVPLYRVFCQKTGFGGTPKISRDGSTKVINREITVRFVANTHRDLPWTFTPLQHTIRLKIGENGLAFYKAKNFSNHSIVGMATYNVSPDAAGQYFNKVFCFCFEQQRLDANETMEMPVQFFIDPDFAKDPLLKDIAEITLSYTFFVFKQNSARQLG